MDQAFSRRTEEGLSIDLREMVWRLLEQWKAIVVFVIIIMLLFSGLMYVRGNSNTPSSSETPTAVQTQEEILKVLFPIVLVAIILFLDDFLIAAIPVSAPVFISPGKTKRQIDILVLKHLLCRFF